MIGQHHAITPQLACLQHILRVQHALEDQRQAGLAAQPFHVLPARGLAHHALEHDALLRAEFGAWQRRAILQVHRLHTRRQHEAGALGAVADAMQRRVHREHDGLMPGLFSAADQAQVEFAVLLKIQLEPLRPAGGGNRFNRARGQRADHQGGIQRRSGAGGSYLRIRVRQLLEGHRSEQEGVAQALAEQFELGATAGEVAQHARQYQQAIQRLAVAPQADFVAAAPDHIFVHVRGQVLRSAAGIVLGADQIGGDLLQCGKAAHGGLLDARRGWLRPPLEKGD